VATIAGAHRRIAHIAGAGAEHFGVRVKRTSVNAPGLSAKTSSAG
jgi:hypothetical protein